SLARAVDPVARASRALEVRGRGTEIPARHNVQRIEKRPHGYDVYTDLGQEISCDVVMYATGRAPNTKGLGLAEIGVEMTKHGAIKVDERQRRSAQSIYAVG